MIIFKQYNFVKTNNFLCQGVRRDKRLGQTTPTSMKEIRISVKVELDHDLFDLI